MALASAQTPSAIRDLLGSMASSLTNAEPESFMRPIDRNMPGYDDLKRDITAMVAAANVACSIEPLRDSGDDTHHEVDLDWLLEISSIQQVGPLVRRRETIHCVLEKRGKKWHITSLKPLSFFAPPNFTPSQ